ncbi:uncharacterized transmembrane protein DDB_G0289901-like [Mercenaria mercenaria]|uniref:uncharacterized transmembrane protein DDB_G0289901-like n=1 Tax=Mercenaria mercenaria TaxID=6596 RepID=UPI00234F7F87|nr:uncharacterized transmembrane protein DDB_G0289901-like [Mercenaria mercenaria]
MAKLMLLNIAAVVLAQVAGVKTEARRQLNGTASCDRFPDFCPIQCTAIDAMGCLVCNCNEGKNTITVHFIPYPVLGNFRSLSVQLGANNTDSSSATSSSANSSGSQTSSKDDTTGIEQNGGSQTSASSSNNMAGCPKLPDNCNFDCLTIGSNGCIVCTCTNGGSSMPLTGGATLTSSGKTSQSGHGSERPITTAANNSTSMTNVQSPFSITANGAGTGSSGTSGTSAQASQNNNGCPVFSNNCDASCVSLDTNGCPVCACASGGTSSSSSMTSLSAGSNLNGCPPFTTGCTADCVDLDTNGCPVCRCHHTVPGSPSASRNNTSPATSGKQTAAHASSNNNGCPAFPTNCRTDCVDLTSLGCPLPTRSMSLPETQQPPHNLQHPELFVTENYKKQQTGNSLVTTTANIPVTTSTSSSSGSGGSDNTGASGSSNTNGTGSSSGTSSGSGNGGAITCPAFDGAHCNPTCIGLDGNGCLSCDCGTEVTTPSSVGSTTKSSVIPGGGDGTTFAPGSATGSGTKGGQTGTGSSGGEFTTFAPSIAVTGTSSGTQGQTGTGNTNFCSPYDVNCPPGCTEIDAQGSAQNSTNGMTSGSTGNGNRCPSFDTKCAADCTHIDAMGCLTCTCSGQSSNDTTGSGSTGTSGNGNGCPAYDTTCPATCTSLDVRGCPQCSCPGASTQAPLTQHVASTAVPLETQPPTTQPSITSAPTTPPPTTQAPTTLPSTPVSKTSQASKPTGKSGRKAQIYDMYKWRKSKRSQRTLDLSLNTK